MSANTVMAISINTASGRRYFCGFGKKNRVKTAWSLAGAELFIKGHKLTKVTEILELQNKDFDLAEIVELREAEFAFAMDLADFAKQNK